jgi:hypothetical protein
MPEYLELHPDDSETEIGNGETKPRPPPVVGVAQHEHAAGVLSCCTQKLWHVRIATDDPIHYHDVCGFDFGAGLSEIHNSALDAIRKPRIVEQFAGRIFISWCQLDVDRSHDTCLEQLELDDTDATPHLEQRFAFDALLFEHLSDSSRCSVEALAPVPLCLRAGVLLAEDLTVALRRATVAHSVPGILGTRLAGSNRVTQSSELPSACLTACTREGVDWIRQLDVEKAGAGDHRLPPCTRQGTGDSTSPEIDIAEGLLRNGTFKADISHRHSAARLQYPEDLSINADLVWAEVDHPVGDDDIRPSIFDR